jgi:hypothetical protein
VLSDSDAVGMKAVNEYEIQEGCHAWFSVRGFW